MAVREPRRPVRAIEERKLEETESEMLAPLFLPHQLRIFLIGHNWRA